MRKKDKYPGAKTSLVCRKEIAVRFSEVDAMGIVWHGNYIKYFEDGRDEFGSQFDLDFVKLYKAEGYLTPLIHVDCEYKRPLQIGDKAIVETTYVNSDAAKIIFLYKIFHKETGVEMTSGETIQVFLKEGELQITTPAFFQQWKEKMVTIK